MRVTGWRASALYVFLLLTGCVADHKALPPPSASVFASPWPDVSRDVAAQLALPSGAVIRLAAVNPDNAASVAMVENLRQPLVARGVVVAAADDGLPANGLTVQVTATMWRYHKPFAITGGQVRVEDNIWRLDALDLIPALPVAPGQMGAPLRLRLDITIHPEAKEQASRSLSLAYALGDPARWVYGPDGRNGNRIAATIPVGERTLSAFQWADDVCEPDIGVLRSTESSLQAQELRFECVRRP